MITIRGVVTNNSKPTVTTGQLANLWNNVVRLNWLLGMRYVF